MTQRFTAEGQSVPVTAILAGPCTVVQVRTQERDGYDALQIGFGTRREKTASKALRGHMSKGGRGNFASLVEFRLDQAGTYEVGQELKLSDVFSAGDAIDVTGTTKGHGFTGVMKRHGFGGHKASHGTHESFRGPGSIGCRSYPGRVFKGKRMDGHMGDARRTTQNLRIVEVLAEENVLLVRGAVPGARGGRVLLKPAVRAKKK